ncbi:hypothetical protein P7C66_08s3g13240 [Encephalitozoon intestinalis]
MELRYRLVFGRKGVLIEDRALKEFVSGLIRGFGGLDLLSRVSVRCDGGVINISADKEASSIVHGSLFLCGEYKSVGCRFERID